MGQCLRVSSRMVRSLAKGFSFGVMVAYTRVNSRIAACTVMAATPGATAGNTLVSGNAASWVHGGGCFGLTAEFMRVTSWMGKSMAMVCSDGLMAITTQVSGGRA